MIVICYGLCIINVILLGDFINAILFYGMRCSFCMLSVLDVGFKLLYNLFVSHF
jgi:hypothetical protein